MEQIAIISDIHGNLPALEAVLEDIRQRQIERIYCLGDLVGKGPDSAAVIDLCRDVCTATVRGNWDETMVDEERGTSAHWQWNRERLGHARLTYLRNLPFAVDFLISGRRVRLFHASPQSVHHRSPFATIFSGCVICFSTPTPRGMNSHRPLLSAMATFTIHTCCRSTGACCSTWAVLATRWTTAP